MVDVTSFIKALLFEACVDMPDKDKREHWEAFRQLGGLKPRKDHTYKRCTIWPAKTLQQIVHDGARRFDALPEHRASIEARKELNNE